jgi:hypothetical protein
MAHKAVVEEDEIDLNHQQMGEDNISGNDK